MKKPLAFYKKIIFILIIGLSNYATAQKSSETIYITAFDELEAQKLLISKGDEEAQKKYKDVVAEANKLLNRNMFSVVNKTGIPPSKSKHDYMSIGPYWWPNPETKDRLPYIRKDGQINPETRNNFTDFVEKNDFISAVKTLTDAYVFTNDLKYAEKNLAFIKAWFVNEDTKMNPNLNYGQSIPGRYDGRCFGIIEFVDILEVLKFLEIAKQNEILDTQTEQAMKSWFTAYSSWLQHSELGKKEATRKNNHSVHYDAQLLNILIYLNQIEEARTYLSSTTKARIFSQIEPDGSQPLELARTKSFSYSVFNLHAFLELAIIGKKVGVHLWDMASDDGRSIKAGYQYMLPYITKEKQWEYKQIVSPKEDEERLIDDLKHIKKEFNDSTFDDVLKKIAKTSKKKN